MTTPAPTGPVTASTELELAAAADVALVRLLISDLAVPPTFTDDDLTRLITLEGAVKLAAAQALDAIASNEALVSKRIRTLDLQTDGPAVAKELRAHATALRAQHAADQAAADAAALQAVQDADGDFAVTSSWRRPELTEHPIR